MSDTLCTDELDELMMHEKVAPVPHIVLKVCMDQLSSHMNVRSSRCTRITGCNTQQESPQIKQCTQRRACSSPRPVALKFAWLIVPAYNPSAKQRTGLMAMGEAYVTRFSVGRLLPTTLLAALVPAINCPCRTSIEGAVDKLYTGLLNDVYSGVSWPAGGTRHCVHAVTDTWARLVSMPHTTTGESCNPSIHSIHDVAHQEHARAARVQGEQSMHACRLV